MRKHHSIHFLALLLLLAGCSRPAGMQPLVMENPAASELAALLNIRIWKFHPPMPSGCKSASFILQFSRKGEANKVIAKFGVKADCKDPLTIGVRAAGDIASNDSRRLEIYLSQGGVSMRSLMDNYFAGHSVITSSRLAADESGRIALLAASEDEHQQALPGSVDNDLVLFLAVEKMKEQ